MIIHTQNSLLSEKIVAQDTALINDYIQHLQSVLSRKEYDTLESSLMLPGDDLYHTRIQAMIDKKKTPTLRHVVVVGIGGSNLGTRAVYEALFAYRDRYAGQGIQMHFLDTVDPEMTGAFVGFMKKNIKSGDEILINIISKSGGTTETLVNAEIVLEELRKITLNWKTRCVISTDEGSKLWNEAEKNTIDVLPIPKQVGGRYSVFSAVGLFPLGLCGIDVKALMRGAQNALKSLDMSVYSALFLNHHARSGKAIADTFLFHPELESLGKWYRQLMGESIGKDGKGISPTVTIGSIDHHSIVQLYLGGPRDKSTTFVYTATSQEEHIPKNPVFDLSAEFAGRTEGGIMRAIQKGTAEAYKKQSLPFIEVELSRICAEELGWFMQWKMAEMMVLGKLLNVNAFDQPHVELYKTETRKMLESANE